VIPDRVGVALSYLYLGHQNLTSNSPLRHPLPYRLEAHGHGASLDLFGRSRGTDVQYRSRIERVEVYETDRAPRSHWVDLRVATACVAYRTSQASNIFQAHYVDVLERIPEPPASVLLTAVKEM